MTRLRRTVALALAACLTVAVAACGSSSSSTSTTGTATADRPQAPDIEGDVVGRLPKVPAATTPTHPESPNGSGGSAFLTAVFNDVQAMWNQEFQAAGIRYQPARLTIFRDQVDTACGTQQAYIGPFYCGASHGVYLDTRFFNALSRQAGVRLGDFAQAYVIGHEVGHHVQLLLGIFQRRAVADQQDPAGKSARSVAFELQADCFAGVWMHSSYQRGEIPSNAIQEALQAAAVVGDDFQQRQAGGTVTPETWSHGSSAQRQRWLTIGFEQGRPAACDTFGSASQSGSG